MSLPERINAIKTVTYYVPDIVDSIRDMNDDPNYEPSLYEVIGQIEDWIEEDLGGGNANSIILQDENGNDI